MYNVNGKPVDLIKAIPLDLGDWADLEDLGVTPTALQRQESDPSFKVLMNFLGYILKKANPEITDEEVRRLKLEEMQDMLAEVNSANNKEANAPFSESSTHSP